jgi:hypothetical protein
MALADALALRMFALARLRERARAPFGGARNRLGLRDRKILHVVVFFGLTPQHVVANLRIVSENRD